MRKRVLAAAKQYTIFLWNEHDDNDLKSVLAACEKSSKNFKKASNLAHTVANGKKKTTLFWLSIYTLAAEIRTTRRSLANWKIHILAEAAQPPKNQSCTAHVAQRQRQGECRALYSQRIGTRRSAYAYVCVCVWTSAQLSQQRASGERNACKSAQQTSELNASVGKFICLGRALATTRAAAAATASKTSSANKKR